MEIKTYDCRICHTADNKKYTPKRYNLCKDCNKTLSKKEYECKFCGDKNRESFYEGRYGTCKKCRSKKSSISILEKKYKDKIVESNLKKDDIKKIEKYLVYDSTLFEGATTKEIIDSLTEKYTELSLLCSTIIEKITVIEDQMNTFKSFLNKL